MPNFRRRPNSPKKGSPKCGALCDQHLKIQKNNRPKLYFIIQSLLLSIHVGNKMGRDLFSGTLKSQSRQENKQKTSSFLLNSFLSLSSRQHTRTTYTHQFLQPIKTLLVSLSTCRFRLVQVLSILHSLFHSYLTS